MEHTIEMVCDGELAFCTTCKSGEGDLTTECCGRPITEDESHKIYTLGTLDFIGGKWITKGLAPSQIATLDQQES